MAIRTRDLVIACGAAVGFASKGIFAKLLDARGWDPDSVLTVRAVIALPFVWGFTIWRTGLGAILRVPRTAVLGAASAGVFCYTFGALLNFQALSLIPAGVERVLLFSYPSMVVLLQSLIHRQRPSLRVVVALALTYAGIMLVAGGVGSAAMRADLYGAGLVLVCALTFAVYYLASDRWTQVAGSAPFTVIALSAATVMLVAWALAHQGVIATWHGGATEALLMAGLVLFATVMPMLLMTEGVRRLGAQRAAVASTIGPPATMLMGALFLGERLGALQWGGASLIIAGVAVLQAGRPADARRAASG